VNTRRACPYLFLLSVALVVGAAAPQGQKPKPKNPQQSKASVALPDGQRQTAAAAHEEILVVAEESGPNGPVGRLLALRPEGGDERVVIPELPGWPGDIGVAVRAPVATYVARLKPGVPGSARELRVYDIQTGRRRVAPREPRREFYSLPSPDGRVVIVETLDDFDLDYGCCVTGLAYLELETGRETPLTVAVQPEFPRAPRDTTHFGYRGISFSPDGHWVGLTRVYYKTWPSIALLLKRESGVVRQIGSAWDNARVSDVGNRKALFTRVVPERTRERIDLYSFDYATGAERLIVESGWGSLSPDGEKVAYIKEGVDVGQRTPRDLYILNPDGSQIHVASQANQFAWSPDGGSLAYIRFDAGAANSLWIVRLSEPVPRRVPSPREAQLSHPVWVRY